MIRRTGNHIRHSLTAQICLWVVSFVAILLVASLYAMFHHAHKAINREAMEKAQQTLRTTELRIDNTLNDVETAARNMHWYVEHHLDQPELMDSLCRQIVVMNPHIQGCAVAFEPGIYPQYGTYHEVYAYRSHEDTTKIRTAINSGKQPYTHQKWYFVPLHQGEPIWIDPYLDGDQGEMSYITSFGMPLHDSEGNPVGVLSVDISMKWFADLILSLRPFPDSHATVMGSDGQLIIHPDSTLEEHQAFFGEAYNNVTSEGHLATISMKTGHAGHSLIHINGEPNFIFYHPFESTGWSVAIVCPESDIYSAYRYLQSSTLIISLIGLLAVVVFCIFISHRQLVPLQHLVDASNNMADGHYEAFVKESHRDDEVGYVQNMFRQMQQNISTHITHISKLTEMLRQRNIDLQQAYEQAREASRIKDAIIKNVSDRMGHTVKAIGVIVNDVRQRILTMDANECHKMSERIQIHTETTKELLGQLLDIAERKEEKK
ncbi:MAG: hypothetical protein IJP82_10855 [Bacteroidaceae bacterium]|nr:hypothetical protein [Bacteroidaceae bacterium]